MKWFKHLSGSLNDSLIFEAIENFGSDGYLVFFGTLETLSDEMDFHDPGRLSISLKKMQKNFQLSRQKIVKILSFFDQKAKRNKKKSISFYADIGKTHVDIYCPKFKRLCDNYVRYEVMKVSKEDSKLLQSDFKPLYKETQKHRSKNMLYPPEGGSVNEKEPLDLIISKAETIRGFSEKYKKNINVYAWTQIKLNESGHPKAIIDSLDALIKKWESGDSVTSPWAYLNATFQLKNGNYWEDHHIRESEKFKKIWLSEDIIQEMVGKIGEEN